MTQQEIEGKVFEIVRDQIYPHNLRDKVSAEVDLVNDLALDSMDMIEITMALEEDFEIEIPDKTAENWKTVSGIVGYICAQKL